MPTMRIVALSLLAGAALGVTACGSHSSSGTVAQVGATKIAHSLLDHWMTVMAGGTVAGRASAQRSSRRREQALTYLISSAWLIEEATERGLRISEQDLHARLAQREATSSPGGASEFRALLSAAGQGLADVLLEVRTELAVERLQSQITGNATRVSNAQIARYYAHHISRFTLPEQRRAKIANRSTKAAIERVQRRVRAGQRLVSPAQTKVGEGSITVRSPRSQRGALERAIYAARPGALMGPVRDGVDYSLFIVTRIIPSRRLTLAQVSSQIRALLVRSSVKDARATFNAALTAKWTARTSCSAGYVVPKCRQYKGPQRPEEPLLPS